MEGCYIAYLGPEGTNAYYAANKFKEERNNNCSLIACESNKEVLAKVEAGCKYGIIPAINSDIGVIDFLVESIEDRSIGEKTKVIATLGLDIEYCIEEKGEEDSNVVLVATKLEVFLQTYHRLKNKYAGKKLIFIDAPSSCSQMDIDVPSSWKKVKLLNCKNLKTNNETVFHRTRTLFYIISREDIKDHNRFIIAVKLDSLKEKVLEDIFKEYETENIRLGYSKGYHFFEIKGCFYSGKTEYVINLIKKLLGCDIIYLGGYKYD